ncbi:L-rhamnose mutarotase [Sphingomonas aracearum]|uniref:L-rhamnose mutarotase n=2 Tax=Sphingomonas aracearum TaxID=2283317 RepID=A0A369VXV6_9SPHN|nr:L-rhamnose mutarotase [Sphingomonas aracearum]RDE07216.1 L-rhamnose mutarotase [Sphingomonas aracearum]
MMIHAFKMQLKPGVVDEYRRRHDEIWPELSALLTEAGIHDYSIFLDEDTLSLFAVLKADENSTRDQLPDHPVMKRWWDHMAPLMEVQADNRPVEIPLPMIFHHA